tara:strand:+ start:15110 stop:19105 length:3996 start_codon:yes stop_codon:yes gene_type:complete
MGIGSVLKAGIKALPDDMKVPAQSVPNLLKKQGVKDEELQFSGVKLPTEGKVSKADLANMESERLDIFNVEEVNAYKWVNLKPGRNNPTYKEKVTTYSEKGAKPVTLSKEEAQDLIARAHAGDKTATDEFFAKFPDAEEVHRVGLAGYTSEELVETLGANASGSRYTSSHFADVPNYLMHSRIYDDTMDGVPTRVITEIQSDLHQAGRQQGYGVAPGTPENVAEMQGYMDVLDLGMEDREWDQAARNFDYRSIELGRDPNTQPDLDSWFEGFKQGDGKGIPKSPFEKTWLRKGMEREISDAIDEGRGQIAIPISGALDDLKRAPGVQKWYESTVASTAKKLAKSSGMDFEMKTVGAKSPFTDIELATLRRAQEQGPGGVDEDAALDLIIDSGAFPEGSFPANLARALDANADLSVTYAVLKPRGIVTSTLDTTATDAAFADEAPVAALRKLFTDEQLTQAQPERFATFKKALEEASDEVRANLEDISKSVDSPKPTFSLYASPAGTAIIAYAMLKEGFPQEDVEQSLLDEGYAPDDVQEIMGLTQTVAQMKAEGYTDEDIKPLLEEQEVQVDDSKGTPIAELEPPTPNRFSTAYSELMGGDEMGVKDLLSKMETVYPDNSFVTTNIAGFFGDEEAKRISDESVTAQRTRIVAEAQKRGLALSFEDGEWMAQTEEGPVIVTPEWYKAFWESKGEFVLGMTGGVFAAKQAIKMAPGGLKGKLLAGAGILGATAISAVAGTELDYLHSAMVLQQDFEGEAMARKAMTATELSVIGDAAAIGLIKVAGKSWNGMKNAVDFVRQGLFDRAGTSLKETFFITDESADEMVKRLARVAKTPAQSDVDKAITATALTKPGAEELVSASVHADPRASRAVVKAIDDRAQDLLSSTKSLEGDDVGRFITEEFEGYNTMVRDTFERVKAQASAAPRGNNFRFDYDKLALSPVLDRLMKNIENKDLAFKFAKQSQRIRDMSKSRRLGDLIELRKMVNEFRFNKRISNSKDFDMLDEIKGGIDTAIQQGAYATMENPQRWLSEWASANKQYSEMKKVQKNVLHKVLMRPGVSDKIIGQALAKYAPALDGTFVEVMAKLPPKTRMRTEGAVLNNLAEKYTAGNVEGVRATNFPGLMKDLEQVTFTTPETRLMKKAIGELSAVFLNDVPLSQASGGIQVTKFSQALGTDIVTKAKFALASEVFHYIRSAMPTQSGRASSLILRTAKLLEDPTNSRTIKELQTMLDGEVNIAPEIEELVKQAAIQKAAGGGVPKVKLYGDGKVLAGKGAGKEHSISMQRIANTERIKEIAEAAGINLADRKALDIELRNQGYVAAQLGAEKVRLLSE